MGFLFKVLVYMLGMTVIPNSSFYACSLISLRQGLILIMTIQIFFSENSSDSNVKHLIFFSDPSFSVISLGESKVEGLIKSKPSLLNTITHHKIIRTYPAGTRTDSSNYNPVPCWNHGCQVGM